ncbi:hypothetical protein AAK964_05025 [Tissierella praeacuta]|uniref:hypothetical protein n=1 Tax=Tissierella praeacuta TaxID=43131 RepID=UPI003516E8D7
MKTYELFLDKKNQDVLVKKLYNQKMNKTEIKRLHRTNRIIQKSYIKVQINISNEQKANKIFF